MKAKEAAFTRLHNNNDLSEEALLTIQFKFPRWFINQLLILVSSCNQSNGQNHCTEFQPKQEDEHWENIFLGLCMRLVNSSFLIFFPLFIYLCIHATREWDLTFVVWPFTHRLFIARGQNNSTGRGWGLVIKFKCKLWMGSGCLASS